MHFEGNPTSALSLCLSSLQFCECLKSVIRDQRSVIVTVLLGILAILSFGTAPSTTVPTVLVPFALWMAG